MLHQLSVDNQKDILAAEKGDKSAAERIIARRDAAITVTAVAAGGYALAYGGYILVAGSAEMAAAGRIALEGCKTNPALCLNNVGIFVADAIAPEAAVGTGVLATGAVKVLGNTQEGAKNLAGELSHASKPLLSNAKPDTHAVTCLIENEKLYAGKGTTQVDKTANTGTLNLPAVRQGKVSYEPGATPNADEIRAGQKFADLGYHVTYKKEVNQHKVKTQDLWVEGIGKVDVYTPNSKTMTEKSILRMIEAKNKQTNSIIIQADLSAKDIQSVVARTWGKPTANNINTLFFQNSKGQIVRYDRPNIRNK
ncbi:MULTISPECIES: hypothetical protein [Photorhabdus]|nr:hypothetical protein [Photorhabdus thracensis]